MSKPLSEQVLVITGASSGIGRVVARHAAERGARVVVAARNVRDLENLADEIRRDGGDAVAVATDVSEEAQVANLVRVAVEQYGRIDTFVANAGVSAYSEFIDQPLEEFRRVVEVNFFGQVTCAKYVLPVLRQSAGAFISVGSTLSDRGVPLQGAYCASKHALKGWIDSLRVELQHRGWPVRVTLIKPSSINTPLFAKARTRLGVQPQPIPPVYDPALAARAILHAAEHDERDAFVGGAGKALSAAERASPKLVDLQQLRGGFHGQMTNWPKAEDAADNLFEPVEYDGGERGEFVHNTRTTSAYQRIAEHSVAAPLLLAAAAGAGALLLRRNGNGHAASALLLGGVALLLSGKGSLAATWTG
jgi:NAD(P)-dependent dehydrogenase (short-subunit alcohol dehydrogenase family)